MRDLAQSWISAIFLALILITCLSFFLGHQDHSVSTEQWVAIPLLIASFVKVRLVIIHFMEVGRAPWPLRLLCEAWVAIVCGAMIAVGWLVTV